MKSMTLLILIAGIISAAPLAYAETVGAHVSKVITDHTEPGYASAAVLICAGNNPLSYPEIVVKSEQETRNVVYQGDIPRNTCLGETVKIKTNNLSSITAALKTSAGPVTLDEPMRDISGENMVRGMSADGKIIVETSSTMPKPGSPSQIKIEFLDPLSNSVQHVNYDILVTQNGKTVLEESNVHTHTGIKYHATQTLDSDSPLDISITLLGLGLPGEQIAWKGPQGEIVEFVAVPEFGTIASLILIATISAVIVLGTKSRIRLTP